ncbi:hypothetical protein EZV61_07840 [Corallincola luteus]|uniref:Uncharacterized protein n=1 Tax=Corallincola luteus TaxID=1775177 RepID=A0ABY2AMA8_9GAMM|nr:hypothetical protein [Corallincola luteus]TCI04090.1 hypothetical protein EZV61_07840 [Corallincola luteus]
MRLNLHQDLFDSQYDAELTQIFIEAYRKRVSVHIEHADSFQSWLGTKDKATKERCAYVLSASAALHAGCKSPCTFSIVANGQGSDWDSNSPTVEACEVDYLLQLPTTISLENGRNDRNFLLSFCKKELRARLLELESQKALEFDGAGGINEQINHMKDRYVQHPANKHKYWLLFDGDSPSPGQTSEPARTLIDLCKEHGFKNFHCLARRAIENYLPVSPKKNIAEVYHLFGLDDEELREQIECFSELSDDQRSHFHTKEGLRNQSCKKSGLFTDIPRQLRRGFRVRVDSVFNHGPNAKCEDFEPLHSLLESEGMIEELRKFLKQLDFTTRKIR